MEVEITSTSTYAADGTQARITTQHGTWAGAPFNPYDPYANGNIMFTGGGVISAGHSPLATGYVENIMVGCNDALCTTYGDTRVTRWKICGTGPDPFVL